MRPQRRGTKDASPSTRQVLTRLPKDSTKHRVPQNAGTGADRELFPAEERAGLGSLSEQFLNGLPGPHFGAPKRYRKDLDKLTCATVMWNSSGRTTPAMSRFGYWRARSDATMRSVSATMST